METCMRNSKSDVHDIMFKSYYVVWKLHGRACVHSENDRLNRTMQYGNYFKEERRENIATFKSYYVVWKLNRENAKTEKEKSLNRTMQYGNPYFDGRTL